jgi:hypothetical protein
MTDIKIEKPQHFIGIDTYDKTNNAYCLSRHWKGTVEILHSKTIRDENEFRDEVANLQKYFDAIILEEI